MHSLLDIVTGIAALARPGEQVEAFAARSRRLTVRAYQGEVESLTQAEPAGIGVRVIVGGRQGFAHAGSLDPAVVDEVLEAARENAGFAEPDPYNGLAVPDGVAPVVLDLHRPGLAAAPTSAKVALALELERAVLGADPRISGVRTAVYGDATGEAAVATSTGISCWSQASSCWLSASALASDGTETQLGGGIDVGRDLDDIDPARAAADAVERATRLLGARPIPTAHLTVVLDPRVSASVLGVVAGMLSGERLVKGRTPFADRVGEAIASDVLTLVDDPTDPRSYGADTHDGEGLATRRNTLVEHGRLVRFAHNAYTARRAATVSTASAVRGYTSGPGVGCMALAVEPGARTVEQLLGDVGDGLLVRSVSGLHSGVNPVSGDFSVGVEGIRVRGGALAEPVREVTMASTVQRMLAGIRAVGSDLEWLPGGDAMASLVLDGVTISGR